MCYFVLCPPPLCCHSIPASYTTFLLFVWKPGILEHHSGYLWSFLERHCCLHCLLWIGPLLQVWGVWRDMGQKTRWCHGLLDQNKPCMILFPHVVNQWDWMSFTWFGGLRHGLQGHSILTSNAPVMLWEWVSFLKPSCIFSGVAASTCSSFRHLENGRTFFRYGGLYVTFSCNPGFRMHGHHTSSCVSGQWARHPPLCAGQSLQPVDYLRRKRKCKHAVWVHAFVRDSSGKRSTVWTLGCVVLCVQNCKCRVCIDCASSYCPVQGWLVPLMAGRDIKWEAAI